jgi:DNA-binding transcriptional MocR family regulator
MVDRVGHTAATGPRRRRPVGDQPGMRLRVAEGRLDGYDPDPCRLLRRGVAADPAGTHLGHGVVEGQRQHRRRAQLLGGRLGQLCPPTRSEVLGQHLYRTELLGLVGDEGRGPVDDDAAVVGRVVERRRSENQPVEERHRHADREAVRGGTKGSSSSGAVEDDPVTVACVQGGDHDRAIVVDHTEVAQHPGVQDLLDQSTVPTAPFRVSVDLEQAVVDDGRHDPLAYLGEFCYSTVIMTETVQYRIVGTDAASVARSIERGVVAGALSPGTALPSVRVLARDLAISPSTVASAYRELRQRGVVVSHDRSRTVVAHRRSLTRRLAPEIPAGTVNLASGNPDPELLPDLGPALAAVGPVHRLYGADPMVEPLLALARADLASDGIPTDHLAVVGGALDGIERALEVHCRVGDRVAVEDPGYLGSLDLIRTLGLQPVPVPVDDDGAEVEGLAAALREGVRAVLLVSRAHNPRGSAVTEHRAAELREVLAHHPEVLLIEDDHASWVSGVPHHRVIDDRDRWVVVRSVAKSLGPDLRVAVLTGDAATVDGVLSRQRLGTGWVSHLLQHLAANVWQRASQDGTLARAAATYTDRRDAVIAALAHHGIAAHGKSGMNVWVPVTEEVPVVQGLAASGWAVQAGEPYRIVAPPAIRITVSALPTERADALASDLAEVLDQHLRTRRG